MTTTVKAANAAEFLSVVPHLLGFHPNRSLVVIPFADSRSLGAMRFDLPGDEADAVDRVASTIIGMVCKVSAANALATVAYTDARFDGNGMPHQELHDALERRAESCGLHLKDALCVAADGWGSYLDPVIPAAGRALAALAQSPDAVRSLPGPDGDQTTGATLPSVDAAEKEVVARALASLDDAVALLCGPDAATPSRNRVRRVGKKAAKSGRSAPTPIVGESALDDSERIDPLALAEVCTLDDLPTFFETALGWDITALDPYDTAALVWCLSRPAVRDIALVQWCGGLAAGDEALEAQLRWEQGEEYPTHLAMHMWGEGPRPDPDRLLAALELTRRVTAAAPRSGRSGPLATCAWLSWALGRSTHADLYATRACEIDPEHGLAEIVLSFVYAGHLPEWAFQRAPGASSGRLGSSFNLG